MKNSLLFILPLVALLSSCGGSDPEHEKIVAEHKAMVTADSVKHASTEQMKQTAQRFLDMWFSGKTDGVEGIVAENFVTHMEMPGVTSTGIQGLKDMIAMSSAVFTGNKTEDLQLIADGDRVVAHYTWKGVNSGGMGEGMPATNKPVEVKAVDVLRFENGKVVEHWGYMEEMKMMQQLGLMPDAEAGAK
ncbi:MAG: ester cyclase [Flavobacteriales bacterium]|nr:ester cyclase [Flavobacteriales bacterium]